MTQKQYEEALRKITCTLEIIAFAQATISSDIREIKEMLSDDNSKRNNPDSGMQHPK